MIRRCAAQEHTRSRGKNEIKALAFLAVKLSRIIPYKGLLISHLTGSVIAFPSTARACGLRTAI